MAKKTESESIIDMFANFGRDLKMPSMDIEKVIEHHRKNLEALEKSARSASAGASEIFAKQREVLQETLREVTEIAQSMQRPGDPKELMTKQSDFARRSFETAVKNASEIGEVVRKSSTETIDILRERIREAMEEMRDSSGPKR